MTAKMPGIGFANNRSRHTRRSASLFCAVQRSGSRPPRKRRGESAGIVVSLAPAALVPPAIPGSRSQPILHKPCQRCHARWCRRRSSARPAQFAWARRDIVNGCRLCAKPRPSLQPTACATLREAPEMGTKSGRGCRGDTGEKEKVSNTVVAPRHEAQRRCRLTKASGVRPDHLRHSMCRAST